MTQHLALPEKTLPQMLREQAQSHGDRLAIRQKDFGIWKPLTWATYFERAAQFGLGLQAMGLGRAGHLGVISENRVEWVLAQMGAGLIGAVTVGVYPTSPTNEVAYVVEHADIEVVVCEDQEQADKVLEAIALLPRLRRIVIIETKGLSSYSPEERERIVTFAEVEAAGADVWQRGDGRARVDDVLASQQMDDVGLMIYTSGSTGKPPSREQLINTSGYLRASRSTSCKNAFALFSSKVLTTRPGVSAAGLQALMSCSTSFGRVGSMGSVTFALTSSVFSNTEHSIGLPAPSWRSPTSVIHFRPDTV